MSATDIPGFNWYGNLPDGIQCMLDHRDPSRRSVSSYLHRLPVSTDTILDLSADPVISLVINPKGVVERGVEGHRQNATLSGDTVVLTPAYVACDWRWNGDPMDVLDVYIPYELFQGAWSTHFHGDPTSVNLQPTIALKDDSLLFLMKSLLALMQTKRGNMTMVYETLTEHLIFSLLSLDKNAIVKKNYTQGMISPVALRRVKEYIEAHLADPILLDHLATVAGISRFHFLRQFRYAVGKTPHTYLTERRLIRASELLRKSDLPITEVAAQCGFEDSSYFANRFRRDFHMSPSVFRRSCR